MNLIKTHSQSLKFTDYDELLNDVIGDRNAEKQVADIDLEKEFGVKMMKKICDLQRHLQKAEIVNSEQVFYL